MSVKSRIIIAVAALAMIIIYFVPVWSIYLIAPQYPEGLSMQIWLHQITGQVEIINGLNHYIGMKHINADMFPEFDYLVYILGVFILLALIVAITGSRKFLLGYLILSLIGGIAALVDFYMWGYDYGHNLDPSAAIQVPGLTYQPPLIGHKTLLNFDAYSYPDTGGWVIVAAIGVLFLVWLYEWRKKKKTSANTRQMKVSSVAALACIIVLSGCSVEPEKINFGKDNCNECKMTIIDPKFGGEIVTKKGKIYKFDDTHCIAAFLKKRTVGLSDIEHTLFMDYNGSGDFIDVKDAEFVVSSQFKSPMGGNAAAFKGKAAAEARSKEIPGSKLTNWATLYNTLIK